MPADITGTEVLEEDHATGRRVFRFINGPGVREPRARRRDQPHAAEDAGRAAAVDAGVPRHRGRADARAAAAVPRVRDAEPDRAGGHVSAARGAARSLHVPGRRRLSERGRGRRRSSGSRRATTGRARRGAVAAADHRSSRISCGACPAADHVVKYAVALARATRADGDRTRRAFVREDVAFGRRPARVAVPDPRREGARDPRRALRRRRSRTSRARAPDAAAPPDPQLPRRGRGLARRRPRRPPARAVRPSPAGPCDAASCSIRSRSPSSEPGSCDARVIVEGALSGLHRAPHHGSSVEFAEHKEYSPGDELATSTGRRTRSSTATTSSSSSRSRSCAPTSCSTARRRWTSSGGGISKLEYARALAASLAYLVIQQQDKSGSSPAATKLRGYRAAARAHGAPPRSARRARRRIERGAGATICRARSPPSRGRAAPLARRHLLATCSTPTTTTLRAPARAGCARASTTSRLPRSSIATSSRCRSRAPRVRVARGRSQAARRSRRLRQAYLAS